MWFYSDVLVERCILLRINELYKVFMQNRFQIFFNDFFFSQFQQVLLLVACLLTQLTFCVSALYMSSALYYCFGSNFSGRDGFLSEGYV